MVCDGTSKQEQLETFLANNLTDIYARSITQPEVDLTFGNPAVSGGDLRSVAATYVSELTEMLPELGSDDDQSKMSTTRTAKRPKGRAAMIQAESDAFYAAKSRSSWAGVVSGDGTRTGNGKNTNTTGNTKCSAGQNTRDIAMANQFEIHKHTVDKQVTEL